MVPATGKRFHNPGLQVTSNPKIFQPLPTLSKGEGFDCSISPSPLERARGEAFTPLVASMPVSFG